jgi:hypothetical protein
MFVRQQLETNSGMAFSLQSVPSYTIYRGYEVAAILGTQKCQLLNWIEHTTLQNSTGYISLLPVRASRFQRPHSLAATAPAVELRQGTVIAAP